MKKTSNLIINGFLKIGKECYLTEQSTLKDFRTINIGTLDLEKQQEIEVLIDKKITLNKIFNKYDKIKDYNNFFDLMIKTFSVDKSITNYFSKETTYDFQKLDVWKMMFAGNMLVSHEMRLGKTYIASLPIILREDIKKVVLIANISIASDKGGWTFALEHANKTVGKKLQIINVPTLKSKESKIKGLLSYYNSNNFDTSVLIINPDFIKTTIGKKYTEISYGTTSSEKELTKLLIKTKLKPTTKTIEWLSNISNKNISKANFNNELDIVIENAFNNMKTMEIDLLVGDEIHEYLTFNNRLILSSRTATEILKFRNRKVKYMWGLTATPAKKSFAEAIGYHLFIHFDNKMFQLKSFSSMFQSLRNKLLTISYDNFNSIINDSVKFINSGAEQQFRNFESLYRISRSQKSVNPDHSEIKVEVVKIEANKEQRQIYSQMISKNNFLGGINPVNATIAQITYLREIALDHRLILKVINSYIKKNIDVLKFGIDGITTNLSYDNMIYTIRKILPEEYINGLEEVIVKSTNKTTLTDQIMKVVKTYLDSIRTFNTSGAKSDYIVSILNKNYLKLKEEPIVIFTSFTSFITEFLIKDIVAKTKIKESEIGIIVGKTKNRGEVIKKFNNGEYKILIGNIKATSTGLNLSKSNWSIYLDLPWQDVMREQSFARIDRLSNNDINKKITILSLNPISNNSIDEDIEKYLKNNKKNIKYSIRHYNN